ncbi:MAG: branched-chain amino acid transport system II carrier protein [Verrucomicrobia bacterium]|nr:branched-chain amino acid transport system II carrier protein [Verrucomicrobiota bacterium]
MKEKILEIIKGSFMLFSMMFGAGNVVFPVLLGDYAGENIPTALLGFLFAGVAVPLIGFIAMMFYKGDWRAFFARLGKKTGFALFALLIAILGPFGAIPRLFTISYATVYPYLPDMSLPVFSALACLGTFLFVVRKNRTFALLAYILTPILLLSLGVIIVQGVLTPPETLVTNHTGGESLWKGLSLGYSLLDLIAAFLYAGVLMETLRHGNPNQKEFISRTFWSMIIGGGLLLLVYVGLAYVGLFHASNVNLGGEPEEVIRAISLKMLGPWGGIVACVAVGMACLTTAISLVAVCSNFLYDEVLKRKGGYIPPIIITLGISFLISTMGFTGIAKVMGPVLDWIHPGLIVLCLVNIGYKVVEYRRNAQGDFMKNI